MASRSPTTSVLELNHQVFGREMDLGVASARPFEDLHVALNTPVPGHNSNAALGWEIPVVHRHVGHLHLRHINDDVEPQAFSPEIETLFSAQAHRKVPSLEIRALVTTNRQRVAVEMEVEQLVHPRVGGAESEDPPCPLDLIPEVVDGVGGLLGNQPALGLHYSPRQPQVGGDPPGPAAERHRFRSQEEAVEKAEIGNLATDSDAGDEKWQQAFLAVLARHKAIDRRPPVDPEAARERFLASSKRGGIDDKPRTLHPEGTAGSSREATACTDRAFERHLVDSHRSDPDRPRIADADLHPRFLLLFARQHGVGCAEHEVDAPRPRCNDVDGLQRQREQIEERSAVVDLEGPHGPPGVAPELESADMDQPWHHRPGAFPADPRALRRRRRGRGRKSELIKRVTPTRYTTHSTRQANNALRARGVRRLTVIFLAHMTRHPSEIGHGIPRRHFTRSRETSRLSGASAPRPASCGSSESERECLAGLGGLEPPTLSLGNSCSIHLSYNPARGLDATAQV